MHVPSKVSSNEKSKKFSPDIFAIVLSTVHMTLALKYIVDSRFSLNLEKKRETKVAKVHMIRHILILSLLCNISFF